MMNRSYYNSMEQNNKKCNTCDYNFVNWELDIDLLNELNEL